MATSRRIPIGHGSFFTLSPKTLRFQLIASADMPASELWVNAGGDGAIVIVAPVGVMPPRIIKRIGPLDALELLQRSNMTRLAAGVPVLKIPAPIIRRAKAETLPGIEALVAFPGKLKRYFEGRGSWDGTGLWVSVDLLCELELSSAMGFLRKRLTLKEAELWLRANDHELPWDTIGKGGKPRAEASDVWRIATRGSPAAGEDVATAWSERQSVEKILPPPKPTKHEQELRAAIKRARPLSPPAISPPRKPRRPRRGK